MKSYESCRTTVSAEALVIIFKMKKYGEYNLFNAFYHEFIQLKFQKQDLNVFKIPRNGRLAKVERISSLQKSCHHKHLE